MAIGTFFELMQGGVTDLIGNNASQKNWPLGVKAC
jgi:hypothetical protein